MAESRERNRETSPPHDGEKPRPTTRAGMAGDLRMPSDRTPGLARAVAALPPGSVRT